MSGSLPPPVSCHFPSIHWTGILTVCSAGSGTIATLPGQLEDYAQLQLCDHWLHCFGTTHARLPAFRQRNTHYLLSPDFGGEGQFVEFGAGVSPSRVVFFKDRDETVVVSRLK